MLAVLLSAILSYLMYMEWMAEHRCMYTTNQREREKVFAAGTSITKHGRLSPPASFRSYLPPDFVYRPLQGALHRSLGKAVNVIVRRGDILRPSQQKRSRGKASETHHQPLRFHRGHGPYEILGRKHKFIVK